MSGQVPAHRFRAAIATLVGIAIGAIAVAAVVLVSGNTRAATPQWSTWKPSDSGMAGAREIADHLAPLYRISPVNQLAVVTVVNLAGPATATGSSGTSSTAASNGLQVAVRANPTSSQVSLLSGKTIAYNLCGIGSSNCSIAAGKPSPDQLLLLRREALELALYTFKYIDGVQNVVAILPPGGVPACTGICPTPQQKTPIKPLDTALLFVRAELKPWLEQPLSATFPERFPPEVPELSMWKNTPEAGLVAQITERGMFSERLVQAQDGSNLILLDPQPPH